jgi:hypothetical protein
MRFKPYGAATLVGIRNATTSERRRMKARITSLLALVAALASIIVIAAPTASSAPKTATLSDTITGTTATGTTLTGTLSNIQFVRNNGQLALQGVLNGTLTTAAGVVTNITNQLITLPVLGAAANGTCQILDLRLGPLDLNLLGLVVHLDEVHLNITAQSGPGNLLGNLLCGLANALNGGGGGLANLLNRLLGLLG